MPPAGARRRAQLVVGADADAVAAVADRQDEGRAARGDEREDLAEPPHARLRGGGVRCGLGDEDVRGDAGPSKKIHEDEINDNASLQWAAPLRASSRRTRYDCACKVRRLAAVSRTAEGQREGLDAPRKADRLAASGRRRGLYSRGLKWPSAVKAVVVRDAQRAARRGEMRSSEGERWSTGPPRAATDGALTGSRLSQRPARRRRRSRPASGRGGRTTSGDVSGGRRVNR